MGLGWSSGAGGPREQVLDDLSLEAVARYIESGRCKKIVTVIGAGISTAAGIPDFRSPRSGLYENLGQYNLPFPQAMFEIHYFKKHPEPFFHLARQLVDREYLPTRAHHFIALLHKKGLLLRNYTQNVDSLEIAAGLPESMNIEAHGTIVTSTCMKCGTQYSMERMKEKLIQDRQPVPLCDVGASGGSGCSGVIKPDVVLFGEALPRKFHDNCRADLAAADLVLILGTSLEVAPFCSLPGLARNNCPRVLINLQRVGEDYSGGSMLVRFAMGIKDPRLQFDPPGAYRDVFAQGTCDHGTQRLADLLGWGPELEAAVQAGQGQGEVN